MGTFSDRALDALDALAWREGQEPTYEELAGRITAESGGKLAPASVTVGRWLTGERQTSNDETEVLAKVLGVSPPFLAWGHRTIRAGSRQASKTVAVRAPIAPTREAKPKRGKGRGTVQ